MKKETYHDQRKAFRLQNELEANGVTYKLEFKVSRHQMDTEDTKLWTFEFDPDKLVDGLLKDVL